MIAAFNVGSRINLEITKPYGTQTIWLEENEAEEIIKELVNVLKARPSFHKSQEERARLLNALQ
jgi:hypothetical protein